jgi:hypothetical protein
LPSKRAWTGTTLPSAFFLPSSLPSFLSKGNVRFQMKTPSSRYTIFIDPQRRFSGMHLMYLRISCKTDAGMLHTIVFNVHKLCCLNTSLCFSQFHSAFRFQVSSCCSSMSSLLVDCFRIFTSVVTLCISPCRDPKGSTDCLHPLEQECTSSHMSPYRPGRDFLICPIHRNLWILLLLGRRRHTF